MNSSRWVFSFNYFLTFSKFLRKQQDIIRDRVSNDDLIDSIFEDWYMTHLKQIHEWLKTRAGNALHIHQLKSLIKIFQKMYKDFELQVQALKFKLSMLILF